MLASAADEQWDPVDRCRREREWLQREVGALVSGGGRVEGRGQVPEGILEEVEPFRDLGEVEAEHLVLALQPACADTENEPSAGHLVEGDGHLRQDRRVAEGDRCHLHDEFEIRCLAGEPAELHEGVWGRGGLGFLVVGRSVMSKESTAKKGGFLALPNDSILKTFIVATLLCLICSVIVSGSATVLKARQLKNKQFDVQKNILSVAGLTDSTQSIEERFAKIEARIVDMSTGEYTDSVDVNTYDQRKASKDPTQNIVLEKDQDLAQIGARAKYAKVYLLRDGDQISKIILPVKGYGLWSTMYGFVALEADANTISDITFYEHNETPGLGGEIQNRGWQKTWQGKRVFDESGQPVFSVVKGKAAADSEHDVDGLAGATLTSVGVTNLVRFWVGENGFGPYLKKLTANTAGVNNG